MKRNLLLTVTSLLIIFVMIAGCAPAATAPEVEPTSAIVNPPVLKDTATPGAAEEPTATAEVAEPPAEEPTKAEPAPESGPAKINGVTMDFPRNEAFIMDQVNFAVYDSFNPLIPNGVEFAAGWWQISNEYLFYVNYATGEIVPWLAQSYEYNADYTEMTIHITKGAAWNDGTPFTANDVAFTMNLCMSDKTLGSCPGDTQYWSEVTATDDFTVVFKFTEPRPRTHYMFMVRICTGQVILPKHIFENQDVKTFKNNPPVTTGPYMLDKTYPDQKILVWKKNENYWNKEKFDPKMKYVVYRTGPGAEQQLAELQDNNTDSFGMDYQTYVDRKADIPQINMLGYVDPCPRGAFFNTMVPPFDKAEFRRAMSMLMNRQKWADNIWVPPSKAAVAPWADYRNLDKYINQEANDKWGIFKYDVEAAKALLTEAGYTWQGDKLIGLDGKPVVIEIGTPTGVQGMEYLMAQDWVEDLKAIGIEATLQHYEQPVWFDKTANGQFQAGVWWMCGATVDPLELYGGYTSDRIMPIGERAVKGNDVRLNDPELDDVVLKLQAITPDDPAALPLYMQAYDIFIRDAAAVPLIQTYYTAYFNTHYWDKTPTNENMYTVPFNWWAQILFVLTTVTPK